MNHSLTVFLGAQKVFFSFFFLVEKNILKETKNKNGKKFRLKVQLEVLLELELDVQLEVSRFPQGIGERRKRTPAI